MQNQVTPFDAKLAKLEMRAKTAAADATNDAVDDETGTTSSDSGEKVYAIIMELEILLPTAPDDKATQVQALIDGLRQELQASVHTNVFSKYDADGTGALSKLKVAEMMLDMGFLDMQGIKSPLDESDALIKDTDKEYAAALVDAFGKDAVDLGDFGLLWDHLMEERVSLSNKSVQLLEALQAAAEDGDLARMESVVKQAIRAGVDLNTRSQLESELDDSDVGSEVDQVQTLPTVDDSTPTDEVQRWCHFPQATTAARLTIVWNDQGWGNQKGHLYARKHHRLGDIDHTGPWVRLTQSPAPHHPSEMSVDLPASVLAVDTAVDAVNVAFDLGYTVGGGGGHKIEISEATLSRTLSSQLDSTNMESGCTAALLCAQAGQVSLLELLHRNGADMMLCGTFDGSNSKTDCKDLGRQLRGEGTWKVGNPLSATLKTVLSVEFGSSGDSDQHFGLLPASSSGENFGYSCLREIGWCIKHDNNRAILSGGGGTEVKSHTRDWQLKGHTITLAYEPKDRKLCFWLGGVDALLREPDSVITGLPERSMHAAVGLYSNSATIVAFEEGQTGPPTSATALWIASYHGYTEVVQMLINALPEDKRWRAIQTPTKESTRGLLFATGDIFEPDEDPSASDSSWCDHGVIVGRDQEWPRCGRRRVSQVPTAMFEHITERMIQVDRRVSSATPLFVACEQGHLECVRALFAAGADAEVTNADGATPFFAACENGHVSIVRFLHGNKNPRTGTLLDLARGPVRDGEQVTPLAAAANRQQHSVVTFLREQASFRVYIDCRELLTMPGLSMPPLAWWNARKPGWTGIPSKDELVEMSDADLLDRATSEGVELNDSIPKTPETGHLQKDVLADLIIKQMTNEDSGRDFVAAFSDSWNVQMDQALIHFASERALVKRLDSVSSLAPEDLFDNHQLSDLSQASSDQDDGRSNTADHAALSRMISAAPQFSPKMRTAASPIETVPKQTPSHLSDNSQGAIRARFMLLLEWNAIVAPALSLIDLRMDGEIAESCLFLCQSKGRLLPDTKHTLIRTLLQKSGDCSRSSSIPHVQLNVAAPGQEGTVDSVFEQLFAQLHRRHPLIRTVTRDGESQLWEVALRGEGTAAFTDTQDVGGHFRTSIRSMCEDLVSPSLVQNGEVSLPLFTHTTNFIRGAGDGEDAAELYLPNPRCTSEEDIERFRFVGAMCGASARVSAFMSLDLASLCWKYILGEAISTQDIRAADVITAELIESIATIGDESTWALRQDEAYEIPIRWCVQLPGQAAALALRGDGMALVPFDDRNEYCSLVKEVWLSQFSAQLSAMADGFYSVFPQIGARLLTWRELERRVCGLPDVDVSQLQRIARYEGNYHRVCHTLFARSGLAATLNAHVFVPANSVVSCAGRRGRVYRAVLASLGGIFG